MYCYTGLYRAKMYLIALIIAVRNKALIWHVSCCDDDELFVFVWKLEGKHQGQCLWREPLLNRFPVYSIHTFTSIVGMYSSSDTLRTEL